MKAVFVTAKCERSGNWWAVRVPEVPGAFTQARRLDQVPELVADAVSLLTDVPAGEVDVHVTLADDDPAQAGLKEWRESARLQEEARRLQEEAAVRARVAVAELRARDLPVRDVATILGISPQRVSQLAAETTCVCGHGRISHGTADRHCTMCNDGGRFGCPSYRLESN